MRGTDAELRALAETLAECLLAAGSTVATAESCTGGWIAKVLTDLPGSSRWFGYGFVSYANAAKESLLGVPHQLIEREGAVSEAVVRSMAECARERSGAGIAVAVSGIAGPDGGTPEKPVGMVWLAWAGSGVTRALCRHFPGGRESVRRATVAAALEGLIATFDDDVDG